MKRLPVCIGLMVFACRLAGAEPVRNWPPQIGQVYPDIQMTDQSGKTVRLSDFKGKIIVVEPISMDCTACQAWSGAHRVGAVGRVIPQADLIDLQTMFPRFAGIAFDDPRFVFVQLLYFDLKRQPTQPRHAREWAKHFGFERSKNRLVLAGSAPYRTPGWAAGTHRQIPGLQLIDDQFILRSDATGHPPHDDIYRTTLPMIGEYVKNHVQTQEPPMHVKRTLAIAFLGLGFLWPAASGEGAADPALKRYKIDSGYYPWRKVLYGEKRFRDVEVFTASLLKPGDEEMRFKRGKFYEEMAAQDEADYPIPTLHAVLREWEQRSPKSHIPLLLQGCMYHREAWRSRGSGWGYEVSADRAQRMNDSLRNAERYLQKAHALNPQDSESSAVLIEVSRGLGLPIEVMEQHFKNAIAVEPGNLFAHYAKLECLKKKWYGSDEKMLAFADQARLKAKQYPRLAAVWISAQLEFYWRFNRGEEGLENPLKKPEIWKQIESIYRASITRYPDELSWRMNFAWVASRAEQYTVAAEQFDAVGDRYVPRTLWGSLRNYDAGRAKAYDYVSGRRSVK